MSRIADIDTLISEHLEGLLGDEGRLRLEAWLTEAPAHRRRYLHLVMEHAALTRLAATMAAKPPTLRTRRVLARRRPQPWLVPLALAAGLVLSVAGWWLWPQADARAQPLAAVEQPADALLPVLTAGTGTDGVIGSRLAAGSSLTTDAEGTAMLRWDDGSEVRLDADTRVEIGSTTGLRLLAGRLSATMAAQPAQRPARFATSDAEVIVIGTTLVLAAADGESAVEVGHGRVRVRRLADAAEVAVAAGECVAVAPGLPLRARPLGSPAGTLHRVEPGAAWPVKLVPGDVVELAAGTHPGARRWTATGTTLRPILLRGAGPDATILDATGVATSGEHSGPRAVVQVEGRHVGITGLALRGARNGLNAAGVRLLSGADAVTVSDCRISDCDQGITADGGSGNLLVEDCDIAGNGIEILGRSSGNLKLANRSTTLRGCRIGAARFGVNIELHDGRHRLIANRISGGGDGEIGFELAGATDSRIDLLGNLVVGTPRAHGRNRNRFIFVNRPAGAGGKVQIVVRSCTLVAGESKNQMLDAPGCQVELTACIVVGGSRLATAATTLTGRANCLPTATADSGLSGTLRGDPGFVDQAQGDFHLRPGSLCRGAAPPGLVGPGREPPGTATRSRERDSMVDIGAFQGR